ncbi:hypothetical protein OS493_010016 [Desmophyllum pertusum]|uniref:Transferrin-like domain-containing protein n=1 Tax=Desmophyllum pertusum TaxID=174260 RepID=A0A9X0CHT3_9CNID|nr:hypothetical protein OS493_010016 [Desmophyllum pertusum]
MVNGPIMNTCAGMGVEKVRHKIQILFTRFLFILISSKAGELPIYPFCQKADQSSHKSCHIGFSPALAVVTRKGNTNIPNIIKILMAMSDWYGDKQKDWSKFQLFNSSSYSGSNLIFRDSATELKAVAIANSDRDQTYMRYLGNYGKDLEAFMSCDFLSTTPRPITAVSTVTSPATALALLVALFSILLL